MVSLSSWSEIKIGSGSCELFVVDSEGKEGQEMDTPLTLPLAIQWEKRARQEGSFFNQQKAVLWI